ncbi:MAG: LysM peptidoglycan-binding domain-containing protein [bacterium]
MVDLHINLLPGVAEKERRLREQRRKALTIFGLAIANGLTLFLTLFLTFHDISLQNNLSELKNKIAATDQEVAQYKAVEDNAKSLKTAISSIQLIQKQQIKWELLLQTVADYTLKTIQYKDITITSTGVAISGHTSSLLDLEKNKNSLLTAAISIPYTILPNDTWEKIAKKYQFTLDAFVKLHNIDPTVPPQADKVIKIKKPLFTDVKITSMEAPTQKKTDKLAFSLSLTLDKGMLQ